LNFSASAFWTDGYTEDALTPCGGGLRKCKCGEFYILWETISTGIDAQPNTPRTAWVAAADLAEATQSQNKVVELAARREYWMHLNAPYRELYRAHRHAEEEAAKEKWEADWHAAHPDRRTQGQRLIDGLLRKKPASPPSAPAAAMTVPPYQPSTLQTENMERLLALILDRVHEPYGPDMREVAELYRELGRFDEAKAALQECPADDIGKPEKLMERLIDECQTAPIRYRL
jgi:hypothetical protein